MSLFTPVKEDWNYLSFAYVRSAKSLSSLPVYKEDPFKVKREIIYIFLNCSEDSFFSLLPEELRRKDFVTRKDIEALGKKEVIMSLQIWHASQFSLDRLIRKGLTEAIADCIHLETIYKNSSFYTLGFIQERYSSNILARRRQERERKFQIEECTIFNRANLLLSKRN